MKICKKITIEELLGVYMAYAASHGFPATARLSCSSSGYVTTRQLYSAC